MKRKSFALAIAALLMFTLLYCPGGAEEEPATPSDLVCEHERVKTTIYFFDSPSYVSVSSISHRVYGPGIVEQKCLDCGEVLSQETVSYAEEYRPHSKKNGVCALCGYREKSTVAEGLYTDEPGERTLIATEDKDAEGLLSLKLTGMDFSLETARISTVLVRGETGAAAIALGVEGNRKMTEEAGGDLYMEMAEREDGSLFAGIWMVQGTEKKEATGEEIGLRFYREEENERYKFAPVEADDLVEVESVRDERGFWTVEYKGEGTYFPMGD